MAMAQLDWSIAKLEIEGFLVVSERMLFQLLDSWGIGFEGMDSQGRGVEVQAVERMLLVLMMSLFVLFWKDDVDYLIADYRTI